MYVFVPVFLIACLHRVMRPYATQLLGKGHLLETILVSNLNISLLSKYPTSGIEPRAGARLAGFPNLH